MHQVIYKEFAAENFFKRSRNCKYKNKFVQVQFIQTVQFISSLLLDKGLFYRILEPPKDLSFVPNTQTYKHINAHVAYAYIHS